MILVRAEATKNSKNVVGSKLSRLNLGKSPRFNFGLDHRIEAINYLTSFKLYAKGRSITEE